MKRHVLSLAAGIAVVALACEEGDVRISVLDYDRVNDTYVIDAVRVSTLDDVDLLQGEATTLIGGADVKVDYQNSSLTWRDPGHSVAFAATERDGVLYPEDYDSFAMASIYYNMEMAMTFFEGIGFDTTSLGDVTTYYWPIFDLVDAHGVDERMKDNAFYMFLSEGDRAFFVLPFDQFQWVPMAMNRGIMAHEYSHAVYDVLVYDQRRASPGGLDPAASNFLSGTNEGVADFMAVGLTGDPDFIAHTIPKGTFQTQCNDSRPGHWVEIVRDASIPITYSSYIDGFARSIQPADFCPYQVGAFVASLLYAAAITVDGRDPSDGVPPSDAAMRAVAGYVLFALEGVGGQAGPTYELWDFLTLFVGRFKSGTDRQAVCGLLQDRYGLFFGEVQGC
jgi:hypothetical protein